MYLYSVHKNIRKAVPQTQGFTLVELMVSLTIFSIVMLISTGTLLIMIDVNAKAQALYSSTTNLSFALDNMTREIRTGYQYHCTTSGTQTVSDPLASGAIDCSSGGDTMAFNRDKDTVRMGYRWNTTSKAIEQKIASGNWMQITSRDVIIDTFEIVVNNSDTIAKNGDTDQPTVDIRVVGHVNNGLDTDTDFNIQTRIVERRFDAF